MTLRQATVGLFDRDPSNPIIPACDLPVGANSVFNPGATTVGQETILLLRVEDLSGISHLLVARSANGAGDWRYEPEALITPDAGLHPEEVWGCED
jgi:predicted GH43/DUF377 family glycosyl hydrolase